MHANDQSTSNEGRVQSMTTIKISARGQGDRWKLADYLPEGFLGKHSIHIAINDVTLREADFWFVIEDLDDDDNSCRVPPTRSYFLSAEVAWPSSYYADHPGRWMFLQQFGRILSCHPIYLDSASQALPFLPWLIDRNHVASGGRVHQRSFDELSQAQPPEKPFHLSVICSAQASTASHRLRLAFVRELKKRFGDQLHWFGNGVQATDTKSEAIAPYRYHLALENQATFNVVSEKLYDSYLGFSYPIYWGAPNINDYFPEDSLARINIEDFSDSIMRIERILDSNLWTSRAAQLIEQRSRVLNEFNFLMRIVRVAQADLAMHGSLAPRNVKLAPLEPNHAARSTAASRARRLLASKIAPR